MSPGLAKFYNSLLHLKVKRSLRVVAILIISIYIVSAGQTAKISALIKYPGFYLAVAFSFLLSLAVIELCREIDRRLNKSFPWRENALYRLVFQFMGCYVLMLVIVYGCVRAYFWLLKGDFEGSGYMHVEFLLVMWMFVVLNLQLLLKQMWPVYFQLDNNNTQKFPSSLNGYTPRARLLLGVDEIVCLQREGNLGFCWLKDRRRFSIDYKMEELKTLLDPKLFIQVSRSEIFALSHVSGYDKKVPRVLLKIELDAEVTGKISEGRMPKFLAAFEAFQNG